MQGRCGAAAREWLTRGALPARVCASGTSPGGCTLRDQPDAEAIRRFRAMIGRAQTQGDVAPAMLAQIASMARNLLGR